MIDPGLYTFYSWFALLAECRMKDTEQGYAQRRHHAKPLLAYCATDSTTISEPVSVLLFLFVWEMDSVSGTLVLISRQISQGDCQ